MIYFVLEFVSAEQSYTIFFTNLWGVDGVYFVSLKSLRL